MADPGDKGGLVIVGIILGVVGLGFLVGSAKEGYERWQLRTRFISVAKEASGIVVDIRVLPGSARGFRRGSSHVPIVHFVDANGRAWTTHMNTQLGRDYSKRDKLTVLYDPSNPENAWDAPPSMYFSNISIGVSLFLVVLGGGLVFRFGPQRAADD